MRTPALAQPSTTPAEPEETLSSSTSQGIGSTPAGEKPFLKLGDARPKNLINKFSAALASRGRNRTGAWHSLDAGGQDTHAADPKAEDTAPPDNAFATEPVDPPPPTESRGPATDECHNDAAPVGHSAWFLLLLWILGAACLDPLAPDFSSLSALGYACLSYTAAFTFGGLLRLAQAAFLQRANTTQPPCEALEYPCPNAPERAPDNPDEPPDAPNASVPDNQGEAAADSMQLQRQKFLLWPARKGGIWHRAMRSHMRARRANRPPGQVTRGKKLKPSFIDEEAWAHDVMYHVMCNADSSTTPAPAAVHHPLTLFDTVNLARESAREKQYKLCPIRPQVIGHSSKHARHRKNSRNIAWAACAGIPRGGRARYPNVLAGIDTPPARPPTPRT